MSYLYFTMSEQKSYVQERLESLHEIDTRIVSFLGNMSKAISALQLAKQTGEKDQIELFKKNTGKCYEDLSYTATHFRREIKFLSDAMKNNGRNDGFIMLPAQIDKKASWVNGSKIKEELNELNKLVGVGSTSEKEGNDEMKEKDEKLLDNIVKSETIGEEHKAIDSTQVKVEKEKDRNEMGQETQNVEAYGYGDTEMQPNVKKEHEDVEMSDI